MKKIKVFIFILSFACLSVHAQDRYSIVAEVNYNTFSHKTLSKFQQELLRDISEVNLQVNDDFGANIGYTIGVKFEKINTQFFGAYNTTGGKISYSDYSGVVRITQLLRGYTLGGEYQVKLLKDDSKGMLYFGGRGFVNFNNLEVESYSRISDMESTEGLDFSSFDFGLGVRFFYDIPISVVKLRLTLGYDQVFSGDFRFNDNTEATLLDNQGDAIKTGWSGFRSGIGIVVPF